MKEDFISFYKSELGVWDMVYQYMNKLSITAYIFFFLLSIVVLMYSAINQIDYLLFASIASFITEIIVLNHHNKKILNINYKISKKEQGVFWGGSKFQKKRYEKLEQFVLKNLRSKEQLEKLVNILYKEAEVRKFSGLFIRGLGISLFLPLWYQFVRSTFNQNINDINTVIPLFLLMIVSILLILFAVAMTKLLIKDTVDRESTKISEIASMLEDISLKDLKFNNNISIKQ